MAFFELLIQLLIHSRPFCQFLCSVGCSPCRQSAAFCAILATTNRFCTKELLMNQISDLPNPLKILFQEYNQGQIESVGFRSFTLHAGESNSYRTLKSALIVPVSGRAIFSFEHEPFIAKRGLFLHGCPNKTLTISAMGEQDFRYINMYYENDRPLLFSHKLKNPEQTFSILEQILKLHPDADIRSQYQQEKLTEEFFAQIFADFQPEET